MLAQLVHNRPAEGYNGGVKLYTWEAWRWTLKGYFKYIKRYLQNAQRMYRFYYEIYPSVQFKGMKEYQLYQKKGKKRKKCYIFYDI